MLCCSKGLNKAEGSANEQISTPRRTSISSVISEIWERKGNVSKGQKKFPQNFKT